MAVQLSLIVSPHGMNSEDGALWPRRVDLIVSGPYRLRTRTVTAGCCFCSSQIRISSLPLEQHSSLETICQTAAPLLRVSAMWNARAQNTVQSVTAVVKPEGFRTLAGSLSEEFGNLLTGVLGHSSLAEAEIGDGHAALNDIHAIERAARDAARLTRR